MTSLIEIYRRFPTKEAAIAHLEQVRWPHGPECPLCGSTSTARHAEKGQADRWQCWGCRKSFSATVGTIFHNSHVDLQRWFLLITLMLNAKKGLSAMQAARDLEMRRPTVWSMMHRIRGAMQDDGRLLSGLVEMDEAYIGGKPRKRNRRDDDTPSPRGRATSKTPIVGAVERGGRVKTKMVAHDEMTGDDMEAFTRVLRVLVAVGRAPIKSVEIAAVAMIFTHHPALDEKRLAMVIGQKTAEEWTGLGQVEASKSGKAIALGMVALWCDELGLDAPRSDVKGNATDHARLIKPTPHVKAAEPRAAPPPEPPKPAAPPPAAAKPSRLRAGALSSRFTGLDPSHQNYPREDKSKLRKILAEAAANTAKLRPPPE